MSKKDGINATELYMGVSVGVLDNSFHSEVLPSPRSDLYVRTEDGDAITYTKVIFIPPTLFGGDAKAILGYLVRTDI